MVATSTAHFPSDQQLAVGGRENLEDSLHTSVIGAASAAVLVRKLIMRPGVLKGLQMNMGTTGSANTTTAVVNLNGVAVPGVSVSIANTEADGTTRVAGPTAETLLSPGDIIDIEVTAAATANADLTAVAIVAEQKPKLT